MELKIKLFGSFLSLLYLQNVFQFFLFVFLLLVNYLSGLSLDKSLTSLISTTIKARSTFVKQLLALFYTLAYKLHTFRYVAMIV